MSVRRVHLVRHGAVHNPEKLRYGRLPGFALSDEGRSEMKACAERLRATCLEPTSPWSSVELVSSPLERAVESAEILASELGLRSSITRDHRLIEAQSRFDGLRYRADLLGHVRRMLEGGADEPAESIALRMLEALHEHGLRRDRGSVVLVSHQLPIQYLRCKLERGGGRVRPWSPRPPCATASITTLAIQESSVELLEYWCV